MSARLTPAQEEALRWVRAVNATGLAIPCTPRRDVLARLAGAGLVAREVAAHRPQSCDRWRIDTRHSLTDAGREALADLDDRDANPAHAHNLRSAVARRTVRRAR